MCTTGFEKVDSSPLLRHGGHSSEREGSLVSTDDFCVISGLSSRETCEVSLSGRVCADLISLGINPAATSASASLAALARHGSNLSDRFRKTDAEKKSEDSVEYKAELDSKVIPSPADDGEIIDGNPVGDGADCIPSVNTRKRPMQLLIDDSSSAEVSDGLRYNGEKAYVIREIRKERTVNGLTDYLVAWDGYSTSEAAR